MKVCMRIFGGRSFFCLLFSLFLWLRTTIKHTPMSHTSHHDGIANARILARRSNQGCRSNQQQRATQTQQMKSSKLCFVTDDQAASMQQGLVVAARENWCVWRQRMLPALPRGEQASTRLRGSQHRRRNSAFWRRTCRVWCWKIATASGPFKFFGLWRLVGPESPAQGEQIITRCMIFHWVWKVQDHHFICHLSWSMSGNRFWFWSSCPDAGKLLFVCDRAGTNAAATAQQCGLFDTKLCETTSVAPKLNPKLWF